MTVHFGDNDLMDGAHGWWLPDHDTILLHKRLTQVERRCVLAHEWAHRQHGDTQCGDSRAEMAADRAAARYLIPYADLADAAVWVAALDDVGRDHALSELADALWVTPRLVKARIQHLHPAERGALQQRLGAK